MKNKKLLSITLLGLLMAAIAGLLQADDGQMFRRNVSKTPAQET